MIISASRRTDIPAFYSDWFINRLHAGFLDVKNPMNANQLSRIQLTPDIAECIVFWTKDPAPMLRRIKELENWKYYFQFTLTSYDQTVETNVRKKTELVNTFCELSDAIGPELVIWRYDPIFLTSQFDADYHKKWFSVLAKRLQGKTNKCVVSILDPYKKTEKNLDGLNITIPDYGESLKLLKHFAEVAGSHGIEVQTCSEAADYSSCNVCPGKCIDDVLISKIVKMPLEVDKDKNQRKECGCVESIDIGAYNTCLHGCKYCYANFSDERVKKAFSLYDPNSTILCEIPSNKQTVIERKVSTIFDVPAQDESAIVVSKKAQYFGGSWTQAKLSILSKYLAFYTNALKFKIRDLVYIDGFAGSGASIIHKNNDESLFSVSDQKDVDSFLKGSAHIALDLMHPFHRYFLIDKDASNVQSLNALKTEYPGRQIIIEESDANDAVQRICSNELKAYSRGVIFLDPFATEVDWKTLECIANTKKLDLWLLFPFSAAMRLLKKDGKIPESWAQVLTKLLGSEDWKNDLWKTHATSNDLFGEQVEYKERATADQFAEYVIGRLRVLFGDGMAKHPVYLRNSKNSILFLLCFAVTNPDHKARSLALKVAQDIIGKGF